MSRLTFIFLALGLGWILQLILSGLQTKQFHQSVLRLRRPDCRTVVGLGGSNLKGKEYVVLVVDNSGEIVEAQRLRGVTVMAGLKPAPELVGLTIDQLEGDRPPHIRSKTWEALKNAAGYVRRAQEKEAAESDDDSDRD